MQAWKNETPFLKEETKEPKKKSTFIKLKAFLIKEKPVIEHDASVLNQPATEMELRQHFLDALFPIQLKWATSTVTDISLTDKDYEYDQILKYFLQRFSDIYLLMYYPIFNIRQTVVDGEIILISPIGIEIISMLEDSPDITILAGDNRTWTIEKEHENTNIMSPIVTLKRTEHVIKSILNKHGIDVPIFKTVLSRTNNIVFSNEPYGIKIIGKFQYEAWFLSKRRLNSTLKSWQLKTVDVLLKYCLTTSIKRPEWEEEGPEIFEKRFK